MPQAPRPRRLSAPNLRRSSADRSVDLPAEKPDGADKAGGININTASADTLDRMLGLGHVGRDDRESPALPKRQRPARETRPEVERLSQDPVSYHRRLRWITIACALGFRAC